MRDVIVIGGGAGGLAAALEIKKYHHDVLLIEREAELGGILNQCIHNGFGLDIFKEEYTGPEYANKYIDMFIEANIDYMVNSTVIQLDYLNQEFIVTTSSEKEGIMEYKSRAVVLTTGSYERTRGQISIPGDRPFGVLTAGSAQRYLNIDGYMVGKRVYILGSGDIGLIMARRMTLEGAIVLGVAEIMPYSNGLTRNIVQCLNDFDIPLKLSHTVTKIIADKNQRLSKIVLSQVDDQLQPIKGTEEIIEVDTLLLSIGLIPDIILLDHLDVERDPLTKSVKVDQDNQTSIDGLFVSGNALQIHDLVDHVTKESMRTGEAIHQFLNHQNSKNHQRIRLSRGKNILYVTPQYIRCSEVNEQIVISFRSAIKAEKAKIKIYQNDQLILEKKKAFIAPAEMETIYMPMKLINHQDDIILMMEVLE